MILEEVLNYYGTGYNFKKQTGMSSSSITHWKRKGFIPEASQMKIEYITNGKLKATIGEKTDEYKESNQTKEG